MGISHTQIGPYVTVYYNAMIFSTGTEQGEDGKLIGPASKRRRHLLLSIRRTNTL